MPAYVDMMAYAGEVPWHRFGKRLPEAATSDEMYEASGLAYTVGLRPAYFLGTDGLYKPVPDRFAVIDETAGKSLGAVVSKSWTPFQNRDLFAFADALSKTGDVRWETAGSLHGRRRVWALAQIAGQFDVKRGDGSFDKYAPFLLLYNAHDGSSALRIRDVVTRVVCANTAQYALDEDSMHELSIRHSGQLESRLKDARQALGFVSAAFEKSMLQVQELEAHGFTVDEMKGIGAMLACEALTPEEAIEELEAMKDARRAGADRVISEVQRLFVSGKGNRGKTRADAVNAVTEFIDHQRARVVRWKKTLAPNEYGFGSAWFGSAAEKKKRVIRVLTRW
jgi:phage/plasmid-like protein (TIGR03299 family)